jgi:hypothetical protein
MIDAVVALVKQIETRLAMPTNSQCQRPLPIQV